MDAVLRTFFDQLHQILGFDTQAAREEMNAKLDKLVMGRIAQCLLAQMDKKSRTRYDEFLRANLKAPPEKIADFIRTLLPAELVDNCVKDGTKQAVQTYMTSLLQIATKAQKKQIHEAFAGVINKVDPVVLQAIMDETELSTSRA